MEAPQRKRVGPYTVACIDHTGPHSEIGAVHHKLYAWARQAKVKATGPAFTCFLQPPDEVNWQAGRFQVCLPVPPATKASGSVRVAGLPATDVLYVVVKGHYRYIPAHYSEFLAWLSVQGEEVTGAPREVYIVHPGPDGSGDPASFVTEIQFPVAAEG